MGGKKLHSFIRSNKRKRTNLKNLFIIFLIVLSITSFAEYNIFKLYKSNLISNTQKEMHEKVSIIIGFLSLLDEEVNAGRISKVEAQEKAKQYISGPKEENGYRDLSKSKLGFNESVYAYAFSTSGKAIIHPYLEDKELWNYRDGEGRYIIREILDENRYGKIINYNWKNPAGSEFKVVDYAEYFQPWGWILGIAGNENTIYLNKLNNLKIGMIIFQLTFTPLITVMIQLIFVAYRRKAKLEKQFYYSLYYDSLTGLPNRILFNERLRKKISELKDKNQLLSVITIDIDKFKKINDTMGQRIGDGLLVEVADRLRKCTNNRCIIARQSADEFSLILHNIKNIESSTQQAKEILDVLKKPFIVEGYELYITASIGISIYPYNGQSPEVLVKNADTAMNHVKGSGRNSYMLYSPGMDTAAIQQIELENDLRKAIGRNELLLNYQPLVEVNDGKIIGMEALLRWNRPGEGIIQPAKFMQTAEETGLILPIGEWVLNEACRQNKEWQDAGYSKIIVSVNISPRQFEQNNFVNTVLEALNKSGLEPSYLELEITENVIKDMDKASETLKRLKEIGVKISLDDFGTGYSSLSYLKKLPIDTLKIDKSFITDVTLSEREVALTTAVINMGHNLKLQVLAEGVETAEQFNILKNNKCDIIQGFYYSRPVASEIFEKLLREGVKVQ